jgi:hypothetical protein
LKVSEHASEWKREIPCIAENKSLDRMWPAVGPSSFSQISPPQSEARQNYVHMSSGALCYIAKGLPLVYQIGGAPPGRAESYKTSLPGGRTVSPMPISWWPLSFKGHLPSMLVP